MEYILVGAFVVFFVVFMFGDMIRAQLRTAVEQGKTPLHKETVGGAVGSTRYRGPYISLRLYDEFLVIGSGKTLVLPYDQIERIELVKLFPRMGQGIQLIHHQPDAPELLFVTVGDPAYVKQLIDAKLTQPPHNATM